MSITKEEIRHLAKLCRLGLTENEEEKFQKEISSILDYVKQLNEIDTAGVEPLAQIAGLENILRKDEIEISNRRHGGAGQGQEAREKILANVPRLEDDYVKIKAVFEEPANN